MTRSAPLLSATVLAAISAAQAQSPTPTSGGGLEEVIVTATKRSENMQDVPISIQALGTQKLEELHVSSFDDYAKFLPSLSYTTGGPGFARVYFRGVAAGDNGNHSGSQPSVGIYLDEQPITTIQGSLDLHMYDIARVEGLAGPQGTLYGASSQAGTVRIITNKPDPSDFASGYDLEGSVLDGSGGYVAEGFVNIPVSERAAVRLVGWATKTPGYIDNTPGTITFPTASSVAGTPITANNAAWVKNRYNDTETYGARAALRIDLNDSWTVTPQLMGQKQKNGGGFAYDPALGDLKIHRYRSEKFDDKWGQAALTVEGKIANFDLVYAGSFLKRDTTGDSDYSDYTYFYDVVYGSYLNSDTDVVNASQYFLSDDRYQRWSHELRIASDQSRRLRFVGGLFAQRQQHRIEQNYKVDALDPGLAVTGYPDTIWLTQQVRVDRDSAVFGELTFDVTEKLSLLGGFRWYDSDNTLQGFYGYSEAYSGSGNSGETLCSFQAGDARFDRSGWIPFGGAPCRNLDKGQKEDGVSPKVTLTYKFDSDRLVYATYSEGFRPGGPNRRGTFAPYKSDTLFNYEIGWKSTWLGNSLRFNGALFYEDWDDFQFSFLGSNGLTNIVNAGGARIKGVEADLSWAATDRLLLGGSVTFLNSELTKDFCENLDTTGLPLPPDQCDPVSFAAKGTELPIAPKFKGNLIARYTFPLASFEANVQGAFSYQSQRRSALLPADEVELGGPNRAYGLADFSFGLRKERYAIEMFIDNAFDKRADITRFAQCDEQICTHPYIITNQPRTYGLKFSQRF
ncbi:MAG: TonB-dependent receptor [Steroidobacteraceae bacterium]